MKHRRAILVAAVAALAAAAVGGGIVLLRPAPASGLENGRFEADCCGTLELRDGEMLLNGRQWVRYDVGRDAGGPYLLPRTHAGELPALPLRPSPLSREPARSA